MDITILIALGAFAMAGALYFVGRKLQNLEKSVGELKNHADFELPGAEIVNSDVDIESKMESLEKELESIDFDADNSTPNIFDANEPDLNTTDFTVNEHPETSHEHLITPTESLENEYMSGMGEEDRGNKSNGKKKKKKKK